MTKQTDPAKPVNDRPALVITEEMVRAGALRFAELEGEFAPAYAAKEIFEAMAALSPEQACRD